jgi:hypothetical protein
MLENKVEYVVTRQDVDTFFSRTLTDREWEVLSSEIESIMEHYVWTDLPMIMEDLPSIIAEDDKYE